MQHSRPSTLNLDSSIGIAGRNQLCLAKRPSIRESGQASWRLPWFEALAFWVQARAGDGQPLAPSRWQGQLGEHCLNLQGMPGGVAQSKDSGNLLKSSGVVKQLLHFARLCTNTRYVPVCSVKEHTQTATKGPTHGDT